MRFPRHEQHAEPFSDTVYRYNGAIVYRCELARDALDFHLKNIRARMSERYFNGMVSSNWDADLLGWSTILHNRYRRSAFWRLGILNSDREFYFLVDDAVFRNTLNNNSAVVFFALAGQ